MGGARARLVPHPLVRIGDLGQRRPGMALLPTRLTPTLAAQRTLMGLSYGKNSIYGGQSTVADPSQGVDAEMLRRHQIALGGGIAVGAPVAKLGECPVGTPSGGRCGGQSICQPCQR